MNNSILNDAFDFDSPIQYIPSREYSSICIFCKGNQTFALMKDGSFRPCSQCRKQFKSEIISNIPQTQIQKTNSFHKPPPIFQTFSRPLFFPPINKNN